MYPIKISKVESRMKNFFGLVLIFLLCSPAYPQEIQKPGSVPTKPGAPMQGGAVKVRSVSLDRESLYLLVGGTPAKLAAAVLPAEAADKAVRWETTDPRVAVVDGTGTVTPVGVGTCRVIVHTQEGGYRDECHVMVDPMNTVGNTPGNSLNGGYLARQGNWVYYANPYDGMKLYKSRLLGSKERIRLSNDMVSGINVVGEWIYYINISSSYSLYKMRIDGTGEKRISDVDSLYRPATSGLANVYVMDGRIYYISDGLLRSISVDGMNRRKLTDEINIEYFAPVGGWIYYTKLVNKEEGIFRMLKDGTGKTKICPIKTKRFTVDGDHVYIINEENAIIRIMPDMGRYFYAKNINASNQWIYWCNLSGGIQKMRSDFKLADTLVSPEGKDPSDKILFTADDWIFYYTRENPARLFMVRADGIGHQEFK